MRFSWPPLVLAGAAAIAAAVALALPRPPDQLLYNHSPSVPVGFYLRSQAAPAHGAFVTVEAARVAPELARARGFADAGDRFLKRVAAQAGDQVCAEGASLRINALAVAERRTADSQGRPLASWQGCRVLNEDEFLLLGDTADSFDGRYWGPVVRADIEGVWRPLR